MQSQVISLTILVINRGVSTILSTCLGLTSTSNTNVLDKNLSCRVALKICTVADSQLLLHLHLAQSVKLRYIIRVFCVVKSDCSVFLSWTTEKMACC